MMREEAFHKTDALIDGTVLSSIHHMVLKP